MTSSRLVGRSAELAALEAALAEAADGRPSVAFVAGESGVGKTRLLGELMERARATGALVLAGECVDLAGEGELPYAPLVAALRRLARRSDPALTAAVAPLLPGAGARAAAHAGQPELFEGLLSLLDGLGQERPVLLAIEDIHWADPSTRAALRFLARSLTAERVLVVASYRPDELVRAHPLRALLAELELSPRARRIGLRPLTRDELAEQLTDIAGTRPEAAVLDRLWERSGGNPLFSEELLAAERRGQGAAPQSLRDALMLRVERLSAPVREPLGLIALGQRVDHPQLEAASGLEAQALRQALREAIDGHVVVVEDDGAYRMRHALLREVVAEDLLPGERLALHLALAHALEQRLAGDDAQLTAAVAHHFAAAGDEPAALAAAVRAAAAAERIHAHREAADLLDRALALWDRVPEPQARAGADRATLLTRAADAASALGDPERQLGLLEDALNEVGPTPRAAPIFEAMARAYRHLNRADASIATLERALELVGGGGEPRAALLAALARAEMLVGHFRAAVAAAREARELAAAAGAAVIEGHARNSLGFSLAMTGAVDEGLAELQAAIRIAREHDSFYDLAEAYDNYSDALHLLGRSEEARAVAQEGRDAVAGRRPVGTMWLDSILASIAFDLGDWELAEATAPDPERWTGAQARLGIALRRAALAAGRGDDAAATALLRELEADAAHSREPQLLSPLGVLAVELRRRTGDLEGAAAAVDEWLGRLEFCRDDLARIAAVAAAGVGVCADAAQRARDLGDPEAQSAALRRADELLGRVAAAAALGQPVETATLLGARAEAARAAGRPDPAAYAQAAAAWEELGRPEPAARMRWREAEAHIAAGDREAAGAAARAAHATAVRLGAGWLRREVEGLAARARLTLDAGEPERAEPAGEDRDSFGLTARERQVLALVAEGATNREIGAALFMAEKTASVHVSRILAKLNVRSRTEAAAVAHRHRLTG